MDVTLAIIGGIAILIGVAGSILPVLPGPPFAWLGILALHFTDYAQFSNLFLLSTAIITVVVIVLDYILPIVSTRKHGGSLAAQRGTTVGAIAGIFFGPLGIVIGPFVGALVGEIIAHPGDVGNALKVAAGAFIGFLLSSGIKLIWCMIIAWWFLKSLLF